jgi:predicted nucleotidyltransferase
VDPDESDIDERVARVLAAGPALRLGVLFGSAARGTLRPDSDVDVGIVPVDAEVPLHAELELQARLERACARPVHLVRLDRASTVLQHRVAIDGRRVAGSPGEWARFVAEAQLAYADLAPMLHRAEELFRARLAAGWRPS